MVKIARSRLQTTLRLTALTLACAVSVNAQSLTLTERNSIALGSDPAQLSGLTWLGGDRWLAVSDHDNQVVELTIPINGDGSIRQADVSVGARHQLDGLIRDYEGISFAGPGSNRILLTEEDTPALRQFMLNDFTETPQSSFTTPAIFLSSTRPNRGFESLSLRLDGTEAWVANEEALLGDGPIATVDDGTLVRLQRYTIHDDAVTPAEQYVYEVEPIHAGQTGSTAPQSGLSDLIALPGGKLLALERSVVYNDFFGFEIPRFENRIFAVDPAHATAVGDPDLALTDEQQIFAPIAKRLLWTGAFINPEGLALGGATDNGFSVLAVTDNQDVSLLSTTIVAFELAGSLSDLYVPGDANLDAAINEADLAAMALSFGSFGQGGNVNWRQGDFNGDGNVDFGDLALAAPHFGNVFTGGPEALGAPTQLPEPHGITILGIVGLALLQPRQRW